MIPVWEQIVLQVVAAISGAGISLSIFIWWTHRDK